MKPPGLFVVSQTKKADLASIDANRLTQFELVGLIK